MLCAERGRDGEDDVERGVESDSQCGAERKNKG
jgi:hypothetical protein